MSEPSDDQVDQLLQKWREGLDCDESRRARMHANVFAQLSSPVLDSTSISTASWSAKWQVASLLALGACLVVGVGLLRSWLNSSNSPSLNGATLQLAKLSFTSEELRQKEKLASELDRLFENQIQLVSLRGDNVNLRFAPTSDTDKFARVILRFVLQRKTHRDNSDWKTIHTEEVVGRRDHQFAFSDPSRIAVDYWFHLLPDKSLWLEVQTSSGEHKTIRHEVRCMANHPQVVWKDDRNGQQWQLLLVYELLGTSDGGIIQ